jgi:PAS domain S-box-containing protein
MMDVFEGGREWTLFDNDTPWSRDGRLFVTFAVLGTIATYFSVNIPYTKVLIEGRWIFAYMGCALLSRWWMALGLICFLSVTRLFGLPLTTVFIGNMMYAFPLLFIIRTMGKYVFPRLRSLAWYGLVWLLMILIGYQLFHTPAVWAVLAYIEDEPILPAVVTAWREQPFFVESLLVGIISALGMVAVRSNRALRASRQELSTTLYSIGDGVIAVDAGGRVRRMNPVAEGLTGWREYEARGQPLERVFCILNEQTRLPVQNPAKQVLSEGRVVGLANHTLLVARDGTEYPIVDSAAPILDENGQKDGVVLVFRDQIEERAAQRRLEESHARLLLALHNARMGIWDWNVSTDQVDWHGEHAALFGMSEDRMRTTIDAILQHVHPDDQDQGREAFYHTVRTGSDFAVTYRVIWPDESVHWMYSYGKLVRDDAGQPKRIVGTTQDITERKLAEIERDRLLAQIQEQARQMEQILDTVPSGVCLLNGERRILSINPMAERALATLTDAGVGDVLSDLGDRPLDELLTSPPTRGLWHEVQTDHDIFEIIARPVATLDGHDAADHAAGEHWVLVVNNVTRERAVQAQLQQQEQLAAVGQLAAGVAHDFNNIMATIVLYAQMTARSSALDGQDLDRLAVINQQAWHATRLIEQILDFSRKSVLEQRPLDFVPILKEQVKLLERTLPETIRIELTYGPESYTVCGDPTRLQQMITNLALNARDAMPEGGRLRITLDQMTLEPQDVPPVPDMGPGVWVRLTVTDTGSGIAPDVLPRIFEPFFTTKAPGEGSGLGLPQVHGIVGQHHGYVDVETEVGVGTTFFVYLPLLHEDRVELPAPDTKKMPRGHRELILVVEDGLPVRAALVDTLSQLNYRTLEAGDGQEALAVMAERGSEVALILSDVVMPRMGGIALMQALRETGWDTPVILLTGHPLDKDLDDLHEEGLCAWMAKPPSLDQLARALVEGIRRP